MVDAADHEKLDASKNELHSLLDKPQLSGIPVRSSMWLLCITVTREIDGMGVDIVFCVSGWFKLRKPFFENTSWANYVLYLDFIRYFQGTCTW